MNQLLDYLDTYTPILVNGIGKKPEREKQTHTITKEKWVEVESAHDASDKINETINSIGADGYSNAGVKTDTNANRKVVGVKYNNNSAGKEALTPQELKDELPSRVSGTAGEGADTIEVSDIPVQISEQKIHKTVDTDGGEYYDEKYRPIPGGGSC